MLGRLKMTIGDCVQSYYNIAKSVFSGGGKGKRTAWSLGVAQYNAHKFEDAVKELVKTHLGDPEAPMLDPNPTCKV